MKLDVKSHTGNDYTKQALSSWLKAELTTS